MKICPDCQFCYDDGAAVCAQAGHAALAFARVGSPEISPIYRLNRLIESSRVSALYEAVQTRLDRDCLIEIFRGDLLAETTSHRASLVAEAKRAAAVIHPNLVGVLDSGALDGNDFYVVTEAIQGAALHEFLRDSPLLDAATALDFVRQAAMGLHAAHRANVFHRRVCQENLIVARDRRKRRVVKLKNFDFGNLQNFAARESSDFALTPELRAPEQSSGETFDARADVRALAIVLCELLANRISPDARSLAADQQPQIAENAELPSGVPNDARVLLRQILNGALDERAAAPVVSAADFAVELRQVEHLLARADQETTRAKLPPAPQLLIAPEIWVSRRAAIAPQKTIAAQNSSGETIARQIIENEKSAAAKNDVKLEKTAIENAAASTARFQLAAVVADSRAADANQSQTKTVKFAASGKKRWRHQFLQSGVTFAVLFASAILATFLLLPQPLRSPFARETAILNQPQVASPPASIKESPLENVSLDIAQNARAESLAPSALSKNLVAAAPKPSSTASNFVARNRSPKQPPATVAEPISFAASNNKTVDAKTQTELNARLDNWISATNARDVNGQMAFYAENLNAYYLSRNASPNAVRSEKKRIFGNATAVEMAASKPNIVLSSDGNKAKMLFRKKYVIKTAAQNRSGEVLQELQWKKSGNGWKIVGERDLKEIGR